MIPGTRHNAGMLALNCIVKLNPLLFVNQWTLKKPAGGWFAEGTRIISSLAILNKNTLKEVNIDSKLLAALPEDYSHHIVFFKVRTRI